ncbi:MAG: TatD DNase family protein, partial [Woeseiaceae bacterium]
NKMNDYLIDIGANLTHSDYTSDLDIIINEALNANIKKLIVTGSNNDESIKAYNLTKEYEKILYSTAGVHPHYAETYNKSVENSIYELSKHNSVVAIGECGLDYYRNLSSKKDQIRAFGAQLDIAKEAKLPVFLHQREAHTDFTNTLQEGIKNLYGGIAHCFTGTDEMLSVYLDMGLYIGITGWICDERRGKNLQEIVKNIPLDRMMIETDCPYLLPRTLEPKPKSRRNEPKYLHEIVKTIANYSSYSPEDIVISSTRNAKKLFNI